VSDFVTIEGGEKLSKQLTKLRTGQVRKVMRTVTKEQMAPLVPQVKSLVPSVSGRLRMSIGQLAKAGKRSSKFLIGTTGEFAYTNKRNKQKIFQGKGKKKQAYLDKGYQLDKTSPNLYAGGIEFGTKKSGRIARRAGPAHFLTQPLDSAKPKILNNIASSFQRAFDAELGK